jgi:integrase
MLVRSRLNQVAQQKGLRPSTVLGYQRLLTRLGLMDLTVEEVTEESVQDAIWALHNPNVRRSAIVALRSVLGLNLRVPRGVPRRYPAVDEDTLRLALMTCRKYEIRGLLMLYCGLRLGESCAITRTDIDGNRLHVTRQVIELWGPHGTTSVRLGPVKTGEGVIGIPTFLAERVNDVEHQDKPSNVREGLLRAGRRVGIHLNPHSLRHACGTLLLDRGVPLPAVSKHLRHADVSLTANVYYDSNPAEAVLKAWG